MRDVKVFTLNDMTFLEYNDVIEKWPSTFSRVFEKAKSYCCGALYPYEVGSLGAFRCLVRNKSLAASGKEPCHFEGWYANREIKLFQWRQKTFGIVSIQVNPWIVPQQHIALGAFNMYHGGSFMAFMALGDIRNLLNLRSWSWSRAIPWQIRGRGTILQCTYSLSYSACWLKKPKQVSPMRRFDSDMA